MEKKISDELIIEKIVEELNLSSRAFALEIGLTAQSIYLISKGKNKISNSFIDRVIKRFPEVNYWFLVKGQLPVLIENPKSIQNQDNLFNSRIPKSSADYSLESFITLKNIEEGIDINNDLLKELIELLKQKKADQ